MQMVELTVTHFIQMKQLTQLKYHFPFSILLPKEVKYEKGENFCSK